MATIRFFWLLKKIFLVQFIDFFKIIKKMIVHYAFIEIFFRSCRKWFVNRFLRTTKNSIRNNGVFYVLTFLKPLSDKMVNSQDYAMRLFSSNTYLSAHHPHKAQFRNAETVLLPLNHSLL